MKLRIIHLRQLILAGLIIVCSQHVLFSQDADTSSFKRNGLFIGFSLGPSQSQIALSRTYVTNVGYGSIQNPIISKITSTKQYSFFGSIEIGYFLSKYIGASTGIGYNSYSTQLQLAPYRSKFNSIDTENEAYELQVEGVDIEELQKVGFLSVPLIINLRLPFTRSIGFFLEPGINMAFPITKSYQSSGTFTYKAYYPAYNVLLENVGHGIESNVNNSFDGKLELKPISFNVVASAGFYFLIKNKFQLGIAAIYNRSLSSISNYPSPDTYQVSQLSSEVSSINSLMGGSKYATTQSIGVKIAFRYFLK